MLRLLILFLIPIAGKLSAQSKVIEISRESQPNEVSIAIDRKDPHKMVAGANINSLYLSNDGGITWSRTEQVSQYGVWGDPVVIQDTSGSFYHFHLSRFEGGTWIDRLVCQRSDDGGRSFVTDTYFGLNGKKAQDKPWATVNEKNNEIYVTWTQFDEYDSKDPKDRSNILFSKSIDRGITWSKPKRINSVSGDCLDDDNTVEGAVPSVGPNGEIYVAWSGPDGLVFNRSFDGGKSWEKEEIKIANHIGGWNLDIPGIYRANGMPVTKCDLSVGPHRGRIYVNWAGGRNGFDNTDIFLAYSDDRGDTWSEPIRVNQDRTERHQFFTWFDIDRETGTLWFVYHDRRNHDDEGTDVYLAWSTDGGKTFSEHKISESPFYPLKSVFFGDYNNISVRGDVVRPVWTRLDKKGLSVQTAIVDTYFLLDHNNGRMELETDAEGNLVLRRENQDEAVLRIYNLRNELLFKSSLASSTNVVTMPKTNRLEEKILRVELETEAEVLTRLWIKD